MPEVLEISLRIGLAVFTGFVIGWERESHGRPAGLRTMVLVCLAACLAGIVSQQFYTSSFSGPLSSTSWHPDPARLGAGVLTGIGFLGAGVIVRHGNFVRGVTTASLIWLITVLGLCYGTGHIVVGLAGFLLALVTLFLLLRVEERLKRDWYASCVVLVDLAGATVEQMTEVFSGQGIAVKHLELEVDNAAKHRILRFNLRFKRVHLAEKTQTVVSQIAALRGVKRVDWK